MGSIAEAPRTPSLDPRWSPGPGRARGRRPASDRPGSGKCLARSGSVLPPRAGRGGTPRYPATSSRLGDSRPGSPLAAAPRARSSSDRLAILQAQKMRLLRTLDQRAVAGQGPDDETPDPVCGIGREPSRVGRRIKVPCRADQPEVSFLDQVVQGNPTLFVVADGAEHQPQIRRDQLLQGVHVARLAALGQRALFAGREPVLSMLVPGRRGMSPWAPNPRAFDKAAPLTSP